MDGTGSSKVSSLDYDNCQLMVCWAGSASETVGGVHLAEGERWPFALNVISTKSRTFSSGNGPKGQKIARRQSSANAHDFRGFHKSIAKDIGISLYFVVGLALSAS